MEESCLGWLASGRGARPATESCGITAAAGIGPPELGSWFHIGGTPHYGPMLEYQGWPSVAFDGANFLVVWKDMRSGISDVYGARVDQSGRLLDPYGILINSGAGEPAISFDGTNYMVAWVEGHYVFATRVDPAGTVLDPGGILISSSWSAKHGTAISFDGANYFVVWNDNLPGYYNQDIYGAHIDPLGNVLDPDGNAVTPLSGKQESPAIAYNGTNYLLIWLDRNFVWDWDKVLGTRVDRSGTALDRRGIPIVDSASLLTSPSVASDGVNYLVAWNAGWFDSPNQGIYATRIGPSGAVLDPERIAITTAEGSQVYPAVAFGSEKYIVAWQDERGDSPAIYAARVDTSGTVLDPVGFCVSPAALGYWGIGTPAIAFGESHFLMAWQGGDRDRGSICVARVDHSGTVLDPESVPVSLGGNAQYLPRAAFDGEDYLVVWTDARAGSLAVCGTRISPLGEALDPDGIVMPSVLAADPILGFPLNGSSAIASDGANYLVVWQDSRNRHYWDIYASRVSGSGVLLDEQGIALSTARSTQHDPSVASDGNQFVVVWTDNRSYGSGSHIYGARVSTSGEVLDPDGIGIHTDGNSHEPAVAHGSADFLVVWADSVIRGIRLSPTGDVVGSGPIRISSACPSKHSPTVAFDGEYYLVVWEEWPADDRKKSDIYGSRVTPSGLVLDPEGIAISTAPGRQRNPRLTFDGTYFMATWDDYRAGDGRSDVYCCRVTSSGAVLDAEGIAISDTKGTEHRPAIASGKSGQVLMAYSSFTAGAPYDCYRIWASMWNPLAYEPRVQLELAPNPFRSTVQVSYNLPSDAKVRLAVFDATGRLVRTISHGYRGPGWHHETWDGRDEEGRPMPSGIYLARIQCKHGRAGEKCVLVR